MRKDQKARALVLLAAAALFAGVAGCSSLDMSGPRTTAANLAQGISNAIAPPPDMAITEMREYVFGPGDELIVTLKGTQTQLGDASVSDAGMATLPRAGPTHVAGLTPDQVEALIETGNTGGVSVRLRGAPDVYVVGAVSKPGAIAYKDGMTLGDVLKAAGTNYKTDMRKVWIKPLHADTASVAELDPALPIEPGDVVRLEERYF
jgi:protein involved in polysaccharide export with SLBB domain